jgi:hypothetical protein
LFGLGKTKWHWAEACPTKAVRAQRDYGKSARESMQDTEFVKAAIMLFDPRRIVIGGGQ